MTPFGSHIRKLRARKGVTQKEMAAAIGVSPAFLSALEHGKRGRPSWEFIQRILHYFNIIWDEADELVELARLSHPRIVVDTSGQLMAVSRDQGTVQWTVQLPGAKTWAGPVLAGGNQRGISLPRLVPVRHRGGSARRPRAASTPGKVNTAG